MLSPLATQATALGRRMFDARGQRSQPLYGITLHTTGSGLPLKTAKTPEATMAEAVKLYTGSGGPHYVIGWDGKIVATIASEAIRGAHAGIGEPEVLAAYKQGTWRSKLSPAGLALWLKRWPGKASPIDLVPTRNLGHINDLWLGIEMIPVTADGRSYWAQPAFPGARFTRAQHDSARRLVHDIAARNKFPSGWADSPRLLGHSDLDPLTRDSPSLPLWDPGYHAGLFDMGAVRGNAGWVLAAGAAIAAGVYLSRFMKRRAHSS